MPIYICLQWSKTSRMMLPAICFLTLLHRGGYISKRIIQQIFFVPEFNVTKYLTIRMINVDQHNHSINSSWCEGPSGRTTKSTSTLLTKWVACWSFHVYLTTGLSRLPTSGKKLTRTIAESTDGIAISYKVYINKNPGVQPKYEPNKKKARRSRVPNNCMQMPTVGEHPQNNAELDPSSSISLAPDSMSSVLLFCSALKGLHSWK